jgi:hypothetical protein
MSRKPDAWLYENHLMLYKYGGGDRRSWLVDRGYTETPLFYGPKEPNNDRP